MNKFIPALAVLLLLPLIGCASTPTATQVLAQLKAASGGQGWNRVHSLKVTGTVHTGGRSGPFSGLEDIVHGRSMTRFQLGPLAVVAGFDGDVRWHRIMQRQPTRKRLPKAARVTRAYLTARGWLFPNQWPAQDKVMGRRTANHVDYVVVQVTPQGGKPVMLWINAKSHRLARIIRSTRLGDVTQYFDDYRTVQGLQVAFHTHSTLGDKPKLARQLSRVQINVPVSAKDFTVPGSRSVGKEMHAVAGGGNTTGVTIPFQMVDGSIYFHATVNGQPALLNLDTGSTVDILNKAGARRFGLIGTHDALPVMRTLDTVTIADRITLRDQKAEVRSLPAMRKILPAGWDGTVGYELLRRFIVQVDYAAHTLTIMRPKAFRAAAGSRALPLTFIAHGRMPLVQATVDGLTGHFAIDSGGGQPIMLNTPFIKTHDLLSRFKATPETTVSSGLQGVTKGRVTHAQAFTLGSFTLHGLLMKLVDDAHKGFFARTDVDGLVGGAVLQHFTVIYDYPDHKLYLKPNADFDGSVAQRHAPG
ncbi:MAG TPA: pepsin/retropepsin-like aspartic protease family protein [Oleiagrimonas sp.]|nr:pepsin/retropepsin-like aspartic protease family protein [Oleiagrimonas sp.]